MRARAAAIGTEPVAEAAAAEHLAGGGGALDAVLAGFFAAAGNNPGVLLGPLSVVLAGIGQGARAFDGRVRQPGLGAKRPRGFLPEEDIPDAARVGAPAALAAALVAHAYGSASLRSVVRPGIAAADRAKAPLRSALLERVAQVGAGALLEASYRRGLLRVAAASEGGLMTPRDLDPPNDVDLEATETVVGDARYRLAPWAEDAPLEGRDDGRGAAVAAVDVHGTFAVALYRVAEGGQWVEELEMWAPLVATPVRRGVPRVTPGTRIPAPAPAAVRWESGQGPVELLVEPESARLDISTPAGPRWALRRNPTTRLVETVRRA